LVEGGEEDGFIEEVFGDEEVGALWDALRATVGMQLEGEVHFVEGVGDDFVFEDGVFVDDAFEADAYAHHSEFSQQQALHGCVIGY
jgi:hypothetical protein